MTTIATFEIEGSFNLTARGIVIYGDLGSGTVSKDNFLTFNKGPQNIKLKIKGVDFLDNIKEKITKIGLTFYYDNEKQKEDLRMLQVKKQTASITEF